jgi:hypothetical protein
MMKVSISYSAILTPIKFPLVWLLSTWRPHRKSADILAHFLPTSEASALISSVVGCKFSASTFKKVISYPTAQNFLIFDKNSFDEDEFYLV